MPTDLPITFHIHAICELQLSGDVKNLLYSLRYIIMVMLVETTRYEMIQTELFVRSEENCLTLGQNAIKCADNNLDGESFWFPKQYITGSTFGLLIDPPDPL